MLMGEPKRSLGEWVRIWRRRGVNLLKRQRFKLSALAQTPALVRLLSLGPAGNRSTLKLRRHVVMPVVSNVHVDPRVQKAAKAAVQRGFRVTVVSPSHRLARPVEPAPDWGPGIDFEFPEVRTPALINHHYPWLVDPDLMVFLRQYRSVVFHCHDLNTALMGLQVARETGSVCIADFHEWFSENVEWSVWQKTYIPNRPFKRRVMQRAERMCMRHADEMITVSDSIATELKSMEPRARVHIVRNIPDLSSIEPPAPGLDLRSQIGAKSGDFVLAWLGGVGPARMIEPVIEALKDTPGVVFAVRGPGLEDGSPFIDHYQEVARRHGVEDRLRLLPPVASTQVVAAAHGADAGLWTSPNYCKSFYFALPNKLFEYLAAGLPALVPNFPEAANLVRRYGVGDEFDPYSPSSIAAAINRLRADPQRRKAMAANTAGALADMDAAREWSKLADLYESVLARAAA